MDEARSKAKEKYDTPEEQAYLEDGVRTRLAESGELEQHRAEVRAELEAQWEPEAVTDAKTEVDAAEAAREAAYKEEVKKQWLATYEGRGYRERTRGRLEGEWGRVAVEELQTAIEDEELIDLLEKRAEQEKARLWREVAAGELLQAFEADGVNTQEINASSRVIIYLGTMGSEKIKPWQSDYYSDEVEKMIIRYNRRLTLVSQGDGKFIVDNDSLVESDSPYERNDALEHGTIITVGRRIVDNKSERLEYRVVPGVPLHYDIDDAPPAVDSHFAVVNVEVDGVPARAYDEVYPATAKRQS